MTCWNTLSLGLSAPHTVADVDWLSRSPPSAIPPKVGEGRENGEHLYRLLRSELLRVCDAPHYGTAIRYPPTFSVLTSSSRRSKSRRTSYVEQVSRAAALPRP